MSLMYIHRGLAQIHVRVILQYISLFIFWSKEQSYLTAYLDELVPLFEKCGTIWDFRLMMDPMTGQNRGYAFLSFLSNESANNCVQMYDKYEIRNKAGILAGLKFKHRRCEYRFVVYRFGFYFIQSKLCKVIWYTKYHGVKQFDTSSQYPSLDLEMLFSAYVIC